MYATLVLKLLKLLKLVPRPLSFMPPCTQGYVQLSSGYPIRRYKKTRPTQI